MDSLFTYRDEIEGKVGIGRLPNELQSICYQEILIFHQFHYLHGLLQ